MNEDNPFENIFAPQGWDLPESVSQGLDSRVDRAQAPSLPSLSASSAATPHDTPAGTSGRCPIGKLSESRASKLPLLQLDEWDENREYNQDPPTCVHYCIEWKVNLKKKAVAKDTETDVVLAPASYWQLFLRPRLEELVQKKLGSGGAAESDDTNVVVSVTSRSERDLVKWFNGLAIDWSIVEKQLVEWSALFRRGKKLRLDMTFNYVEKAH